MILGKHIEYDIHTNLTYKLITNHIIIYTHQKVWTDVSRSVNINYEIRTTN